jgi:hypothetical protein
MYAKAIRLYRMSPEAQADDIGMLRYQTVVMAQRNTPLTWGRWGY